MKNRKSRFITILLILTAIFSVGFPIYSQNNIILPIERGNIASVANDIIIKHIETFSTGVKGDIIIPNSIKVHTIESLHGEVYILYSMDVRSPKVEDELEQGLFQHVYFYSLRKVNDEYGYDIKSGGGSGAPYQLHPIDWINISDIYSGVINDKRVTRIELYFDNGDVINHELKGDDYFIIEPPKDNESAILTKIKAYDKDDNSIYEKYPN